MKCLSQLSRLFKAAVPPAPEEIEQHVRRLNLLLLAYQQLKTLTVAEWRATEREMEMEKPAHAHPQSEQMSEKVCAWRLRTSQALEVDVCWASSPRVACLPYYGSW
jgi:hypothetical protein